MELYALNNRGKPINAIFTLPSKINADELKLKCQ